MREVQRLLGVVATALDAVAAAVDKDRGNLDRPGTRRALRAIDKDLAYARDIVRIAARIDGRVVGFDLDELLPVRPVPLPRLRVVAGTDVARHIAPPTGGGAA